ncbi:unnamed protein product [Blepharisma stoltei]|uniref:Uncharacterized protein n=1 Tax=Blepharisma stoltei TaxID=1481888 RepID=A0AAU9IQ22_9CILI|nr:unnamed protein product [Blepharisma stoltei]
MENNQPNIIERLKKRQRIGRTKIFESLDSIVEQLETFVENDSEEVTDEEFQTKISNLFQEIKDAEPLRNVCKEHRETYAYISKLGKEIEQNGTMNPEDLQCHATTPLDESIINSAIHEYFMREGMFEEADYLQDLKQIQGGIAEAKEQFKMIYQVLKSLEEGNIDYALKWVEDNSQQLKSSSANLQFNLHKLKFLNLLRRKDSATALEYAKTNMQAFKNTHIGEIQQLMGACLFLSQPENSPYQELLDPEYDKIIAQQLIQEWCKTLGLPFKSSLVTAITAGLQIMPEMIQLANITGGNKIWTQPMPTELNLDPKLRFHSIFVCPVSREISTPENPPMLLPCGHMISKQSMERLLSSSSRGKFKCPTCPVEATDRDIRQVTIW